MERLAHEYMRVLIELEPCRYTMHISDSAIPGSGDGSRKHGASGEPIQLITDLHYEMHSLFDRIEEGHTVERGSEIINVAGIPDHWVALYGMELIVTLEELHRRHIFVKDLNSEEIFLSEAGHIQMHQFGQHFYERGTSKQAMKMFVAEDLLYYSPEAAIELGSNLAAARPSNAAMDYWSFGVLMFEMLTGELPFDATGETFGTMVQKLHTLEGLKIPERLSHHARDILKRLLERNPRLRLGMLPNASGTLGGWKEIADHPFFSDRGHELPKFRRADPVVIASQIDEMGHTLRLPPIGTKAAEANAASQAAVDTNHMTLQRGRSGRASMALIMNLRNKYVPGIVNRAARSTSAADRSGGDAAGGGAAGGRRSATTTARQRPGLPH